MQRLTIFWICFFVAIERINNVQSQNRKNCLLPQHPSFGSWHYVNKPSNSNPGLQVPVNSILRINCNDGYKLDGDTFVVCLNGQWVKNIGKCLKICPSLHSTSTLNITCTFKDREVVNCTEPLEGTVAKFKCDAFYDDTRVLKSKAIICVDGKWSANTPECAPVCGRAVVKKRPTLIVHADLAKKGDFPWQIAIYQKNVLICGGTLLSERVILTAAHCISSDSRKLSPKDQFVVVAGKYYRKLDHPDDLDHIQISEVHDMFISENYLGDEQNYEGDIAIIISKKMFKFTNRIQPVCIDWGREFENEILGPGKQKGFVSGWGNTRQNSHPADELRSLTVPSLARKQCRDLLPFEYKRYMTHDKFCAGYKDNGTSVCGGDSGGGLVFTKDGRYFIAGVVSLAPLADSEVGGCDTQQYGLYTLVYTYSDTFILKKLVEYKIPDATDRSCNNCTTSTTTERYPVPSDPNSCFLPPQPKFGHWLLVNVEDPTIEYVPGAVVKSRTGLHMVCQENYTMDESNNAVYCWRGIWSAPFKNCLKPCPPLFNSTSTKVTCTRKNEKKEDCSPALHGTVATFQCSKFYTFSTLNTKPSVCLDGTWSHIPECVRECGQVAPNRTVMNGKHPWHVSVYAKLDNITNQHQLLCGGTLINTNMVITAAHCVKPTEKDEDPTYFTVGVANYHKTYKHSEDTHAQFITAKKILVPKEYKGASNYGFADIAIIVTEKPFVLSSRVQPVCIFWKGFGEPPADKQALVSGYDSHERDQSAVEELKENNFKILPLPECVQSLFNVYGEYFTSDKFCAKCLDRETALCFGNNGAGLVINEGSKNYLIGVLGIIAVSGENQTCDPKINMMFTNIDPYIDEFILDAEARYKI